MTGANEMVSVLLPLQVSEAKKKKAQAKKAKAPGGAAVKAAAEAASPNENTTPTNGSMADLSQAAEELEINNDRSSTCVLTSHPQSRDVHLESFTLLFHGHELLVDADLELNYGRRAAMAHAHNAHACMPVQLVLTAWAGEEHGCGSGRNLLMVI